MLHSRAKASLLVAWGLCLAGAAGAAPALYFHWEGGLSPYGFATVEIAPDGGTSCDISYMGQRIRSTFMLTQPEVAYLRHQFERTLGTSDQATWRAAPPDRGLTIWRMIERGRTREVSGYTDNPWARRLEHDMWRIVRREAVAASLRHGDPKARYHRAYEAQSDLRQGRIYRPEGMRRALLDAAGDWPLAGLSFLHSRDTIGNLLQALAYCEPREQWAGDVMALYTSKPPEGRVVMLRAVASLNFLSDLKGRQGQVLVPLMLEGLDELLADPGVSEEFVTRYACSELVAALGCLRDARAVELLASDSVWKVRPKLDLAGAAASALAQIGPAGAEALLKKADSDDERIRRTAQDVLSRAVETYTRKSSCLPPELQPWESPVAELRQFLVYRGLDPTALDVPLPERAAAALRSRHPGWLVMETPQFDASLVRHLRSEVDEVAGPQHCHGDFDGDGRRDIALLLRKEDAVKLIVLRGADGRRWTTDELTRLSYQGGFQSGYEGFTVFITSRPAGPVAFWPGEGTEKSGRLELENDGIERHFAGKGSTLYYWTPKGYRTVQTAD